MSSPNLDYLTGSLAAYLPNMLLFFPEVVFSMPFRVAALEFSNLQVSSYTAVVSSGPSKGFIYSAAVARVALSGAVLVYGF